MVGLALALLAIAERSGLLHLSTDPARLRDALLDLGGWGYLAFVVAFALMQPFGVPGMAFVVAAPLIWPWPVAFALSMTGAMGASVVGFSFARFVARDWINERIPERFRRYDEALARRGLATVSVLRLIFWMPPLLHAFFGVSKVRFSTHFWGSLLGYLLPLALITWLGPQILDAVARAVPLPAIAIAVLAVAAIAAMALWHRHRHRDRSTGE
jgi:uncharacterized membrane protein YdjX (TVP38/TMEM64 family)